MVPLSISMYPSLTALDAQTVQPTVYVLDREPCLLGRGEGCAVRIQRSGVSRQHALIVSRDGAFHIIDQRSSWGTYVNGERIAPMERYRLSNNALIGLGSPKPILRFCDPDPTRPPLDLEEVPESILVHDSARQRFVLHGQPLELPFLAYRLLKYLSAYVGGICPANSCIQAVWEIDELSADELANRLYRLINELRAALEAHQQQIDPLRRVHVESHRRRGYSLVIPDESARG